MGTDLGIINFSMYAKSRKPYTPAKYSPLGLGKRSNSYINFKSIDSLCNKKYIVTALTIILG